VWAAAGCAATSGQYICSKRKGGCAAGVKAGVIVYSQDLLHVCLACRHDTGACLVPIQNLHIVTCVDVVLLGIMLGIYSRW
jgi:hypothetical protein